MLADSGRQADLKSVNLLGPITSDSGEVMKYNKRIPSPCEHGLVHSYSCLEDSLKLLYVLKQFYEP